MMNFLPIVYEDELLFSMISRYQRMCGMISKRALERDLFNQRRNMTSVFFPQYINVLVSNFPPTSKITTNEIIMNHTMFPFYTAFLSQKKTEEIFNFMAEGSGKSIENMVGIAGSKIKQNDYLKYCPLCFKEDMEILGESYWRRIHQIPGALYCFKHQVLLKNSNILSTDSRVDYCCADEDACNETTVDDLYSPRIKELNLKYIQNAIYLLFENQKRKNLNFIISFYIDKLRERGFASKGGSLYINKLLEAFVDYYPSEYLELMQSSIDVEKETNWLRLFVRNNNKNRSPLRHLLFMQFLDVDIQELFHCDKVIGKRTVVQKRSPSFELDKRRQDWLKIIRNNPGATRSELKSIGKGLHTWIYTHDRDWYEQVTPRVTTRKKRTETIDWNKRDEECLALAKNAVEKLLKTEGKPIRIIPANIRRVIGAKRWFYHEKLVKTHQYLKEITEDIDSYRVRKIKWAIDELNKNGEKLTAYKIQLKAGFGGGNNEVRSLIEQELAK
jgi:hypothetical protein